MATDGSHNNLKDGYSAHCSLLTLHLTTPCSVGVAAAGGRLGPATSSGTGPVHGTQGRGWSVVTTILRNTILREGAYISTFTLKNLFLRTLYLVAPSLNIGLVSTWRL